MFKWVKCCSGTYSSVPPLHAHPPQSLLSLEQACSSCCVNGGASQGGKRMTGTQSAFILCAKCSSLSLFPFICPISPFLYCQASPPSSDKVRIPTEWDKEREKGWQWGGGERWWDASVLSHDHWEQRETTWCVDFSAVYAWVCLCVWWGVFVYLLLKCTIVQHSGDCVYLSLFSNAGRKKEEEKKTLNKYLRNLIEEILKTEEIWGWENGREWRETAVKWQQYLSFHLAIMCTSLVLFKVLVVYWQLCICYRWKFQ